MYPPEERPSLICLGGAERFFSGIRFEPRDAFRAAPRDKEGKLQEALISCHNDIKFFLSRDNKLARDAGHVVGELQGRGRKEDADKLETYREHYLKARACSH